MRVKNRLFIKRKRCNRNVEEHEQMKEDTGIKKEKIAKPENNKEEENEKNEEINMVELQSEDNEKKLK